MLFHQSQRSRNKKLYDALFNPATYYNMLRKDIDECCEIATRYDLVSDTEAGLLRGGRNIYEDSFLNEFRVARLFENYFGKGCLKWNPLGKGEKLGEFLLNINRTQSIFVEVKTKEEKNALALIGILRSKEKSILESLKSAYKKADDNLNISFFVVLSNNRFNIEIDSFQIIKAYLGLITYKNGSPKVISHGFCAPDRHRKLSAIGHYFYNVEPESQKLQEFFRIYHNPYSNCPIPCNVFDKKADYQFVLSKWNGRFEQ